MTAAYTGGCQCGAVRFRFEGELGRASLCHCRMCQKAFGSFFGPFVTATRATFRWTRGAPKYFQSSNRRGFCSDCGTQLTFETQAAPSDVELAIGAFDDPASVRPSFQICLESKLPWFDQLADLPTRSPDDQAEVAGYYASIESLQHPDHDTDDGPR